MAYGVCTERNEQLSCPGIGDFDWWLLRLATVACKCTCFDLWFSFSEKLALAVTSRHSSCQFFAEVQMGGGCWVQ